MKKEKEDGEDEKWQIRDEEEYKNKIKNTKMQKRKRGEREEIKIYTKTEYIKLNRKQWQY